MTLEEYADNEQDQLVGFQCFMHDRVVAAVETSELSWRQAFNLWRLLSRYGVDEAIIDDALHQMLGGWYMPKYSKQRGGGADAE